LLYFCDYLIRKKEKGDLEETEDKKDMPTEESLYPFIYTY
jgi:hypothetical protein